MVFVDYVVMPARPGGTRLAKTHIRACHLLQLDGYVLHDMTEPGSFAFAHASHEPTRGFIGTTMLLQAGQIAKKTIDEALAEARRRPLFKDPQIDGVPNDREMSMNIRSLISYD